MKQSRKAEGQSAQINVRIDRSIKEEGDAVLAEAGMSPSQIVRALWGKLAQRGTALDEVVAALGSQSRSAEEQAAIDAKLAVVDRALSRRDELAQQLGLSSVDEPLYPDGYDWRERSLAERARRRDRRGQA